MFPVDSPAAAEAACRTITARVAAYRPDIMLAGFLIEAYRPAQPEWILSLRNDPHFGPVVMFGLGGLFVETLRQVSFRLAPLRERGYRGAAERTARHATAFWRARSRTARDRPRSSMCYAACPSLSMQPAIVREISEIEINPLAVDRNTACWRSMR